MSAYAVPSTNAALEWDVAAAAMPGETLLGDCSVVAFAEEHVLLAVVDGLGHGAKAADAAQAATRTLKHSGGQDVASAVLDCHRALVHTRGAALSLASIDCRAHTVEWLGVGNVEARRLRFAEPLPVTDSLLLRTGIVGHELPRLTPQTMSVSRGDLLIFATDGIRRDFADGLMPAGSCREIAQRILRERALGTDDALVLVARYLGRR